MKPHESRSKSKTRGAATEFDPIRWVLISIVLSFLGLFLVLPLIAVFGQALSNGVAAYWSAIGHPEALNAIRLSLVIAAIVVPLNVIFGVVAAWTIAKYDFPFKNVLIALIDLPFTVSPVISGAIFIMIFGARGVLGEWLVKNGLQVIFATPGMVLATIFVTFPLVARELIPLMQAQGTADEEAALVLGASGFQTFWRITLPNIRWGLLSGVIIWTARALGEFGAVSAVSGHIRGRTITLPLQVEILYNEYHFVMAFAVASLLALFGIVTLVLKQIADWQRLRQNSEEEEAGFLVLTHPSAVHRF